MKLKKGILFFLCIVWMGTTSAQSKLTIAVAANMQYCIQDLIKAYNKANHIPIEVVLGASGKLTQQIMNGAPFDIFISADRSFPQKLAEEHHTAAEPKVYAQGILVLWAARGDLQPAKDLQLLLNKNIKKIAIANPRTAPYGTAAEAILKKYGLYDKVADKLVTGESIAQTSQFISTQNADIGFTAKAIVISGEMKGKGRWVELNSKDYPPIEQSAVLIKSSKEGKAFYDFLYSAKARDILRKFGYISL